MFLKKKIEIVQIEYQTIHLTTIKKKLFVKNAFVVKIFIKIN